LAREGIVDGGAYLDSRWQETGHVAGWKVANGGVWAAAWCFAIEEEGWRCKGSGACRSWTVTRRR